MEWDRTHQPHLSAGQAAASIVWTLAPVATFGLTSWAVILFGAIRLGSRQQAVAAAIYALLIVGDVVFAGGAADGSRTNEFAAIVLFLVGLIGTLHASAIRREVFATVVEQNPEVLATTEWKHTQNLRKNARRLATRSPQEALDLLVGRVDLPAEQRRYDDGGLIDVNNVPPAALTAAAGIDREMAARIAATRVDVGGFDSADDLSVALGLPARLLDTVSDRLIFLPLLPATVAAAAEQHAVAEAATAEAHHPGRWFGFGRGSSRG